MTTDRKPRVLILIVANQADETIRRVLQRIPKLEACETEVLLIDDCPIAATPDLVSQLRQLDRFPHRLTVLTNPVKQGSGGNQKLGCHYAIREGFDIVAFLHGDGRHDPAALPELLSPLARGEADVVLGSRTAASADLSFFRSARNRILSWLHNRLLHSNLSAYHSGLKICAVPLLRKIPFELNANTAHFEIEIIIQFLRSGGRIVERPIPALDGVAIRPVDGPSSALDEVRACLAARLQEFGLVYRRNFDLESVTADNKHYLPKLDFPSTHSRAIAEVPAGATVMDIGCGPGHLCAALHTKSCSVIGVDQFKPSVAEGAFDEFYVTDLNVDPCPRSLDDVHVLLVLDIIEHLISPEKFCDELRRRAQANRGLKIVISTGNVGFVVTRLMLFLGQFNYNKRGILDLTHTRLFTFSSLRRLLQETGFVVEKEMGIPAPIPLVVKNRFFQGLVMSIQDGLMRISRGLFAYQMFMVVRPLPTLETLMRDARHQVAERAATPSRPAARP